MTGMFLLGLFVGTFAGVLALGIVSAGRGDS